MESIQIFKTEQELITAAADYFVETATHAIAKNHQFSVALSGGHSPQKLYAILASDNYKNKVDWKKVSFFFGDERYVPENDPLRNSLMAQHALFDTLQIKTSQVFKVDTTLSPENAAAAYYESIKKYFKEAPIQFDLVLLGLGDNAHTASLFPSSNVLEETERTVKSLFLEEQQLYRITMSAPLINHAKQIAFLVFGEAKAKAVNQVLNGPIDTNKYPAQLIHPIHGELHWFLDQAAASLYSDETNN